MLRKRVSYLSNGGQHFLAFTITLSLKLVRREKYHFSLAGRHSSKNIYAILIITKKCKLKKDYLKEVSRSFFSSARPGLSVSDVSKKLDCS